MFYIKISFFLNTKIIIDFIFIWIRLAIINSIEINKTTTDEIEKKNSTKPQSPLYDVCAQNCRKTNNETKRRFCFFFTFAAICIMMKKEKQKNSDLVAAFFHETSIK